MAELKIGIIEDNHAYRQNLIQFLSSIPIFKVVVTSDSFEKYDLSKSIDVLLLDISLPGIDGLSIIPEVLKLESPPEVIMLTAHEESEKVFTALKLGASAYLSKRTSLHKIKESIHVVSNGGSFMSPEIARKVFNYFSKPPSKSSKELLTKRQQEIVTSIVEGQSYKLIAADLNITIDTVRDHIKKIYRTLKVNSKSEVISKYYKGEL